MRLVEVAERDDDIGGRSAGGESGRGRAGAFDLPHRAAGETGGRAEPAFDGAIRDRGPGAPVDLGDERVTEHGSGADEARDQGLGVLPFCGFVREHVRRNPEYLDLVPEDQRRRFGLAA